MARDPRNLAHSLNINIEIHISLSFLPIFVFSREPGVHQSLQEEWEQTSDLLQNILVSRVPSFMKTQTTPLSLAEALRAVGWRATTRLAKAAEYLAIDFENGNPANQLSARYFPITGEGQDVIITDPRGYESITDIISRPFHEKIRLNHRVLSIKHSNKHYTLQTANGKIFRSKYVMVSVSHQVLQYNKINFDPQLPMWKIQSLDKIVTGDYCKIFLNYPFKFWDDSNYIMIGQTTKEYIHWQNIQRIYVNKNILMVTLTGEECKQSQKDSDRLVISKAQHALSQVYGDIPSPIGASSFCFHFHLFSSKSTAIFDFLYKSCCFAFVFPFRFFLYYFLRHEKL